MATKKKKIRTDFIGAYGAPQAPLDLNSQQFRFTLVRPGLASVPVDGLIETVEWRDEGAVDTVNRMPILRGSVQMRKPENGNAPAVRDGDKLRCHVFWVTKWIPLWEMRLTQDRVNIEDGTWTFEAADDLNQLALGQIHARYVKKTGKRRLGWFYHEIVRDLCRRYNVPVGTITAGTERITNFDEPEKSILEVIYDALQKEIDGSGRRYVMRWGPTHYSTGKKNGQLTGRFGLEITPMRRNPMLYVFASQIRTALVGHDRRGTLATVVVATGSQKGGKKKARKKIKVKITDKRGRDRYGYIERKITLPGNVESTRKAKQLAQRSLAKGLSPIRIIEDFTHPGIATVRRGDAIRVSVPSEGYVGARGIVFVTSVVHNLSASDYTMTLTLGFLDPLDPNKIRAEREAALRAKKRKAKAKKK